MHHGFALGQGCCHEQVFGAGDGNLVEENLSTLKALGAGFDVSVILHDSRAQTLQSFDMQINRPSSYGAASREGDAGSSATRYQRAEDQR